MGEDIGNRILGELSSYKSIYLRTMVSNNDLIYTLD